MVTQDRRSNKMSYHDDYGVAGPWPTMPEPSEVLPQDVLYPEPEEGEE